MILKDNEATYQSKLDMQKKQEKKLSKCNTEERNMIFSENC